MRIYVIAEIGINHNGDLDLAKHMMKEAAKAGADCVKFQKRTPEVCVPREQWHVRRQTPWGEMDYIDYKHRIEFSVEDYAVIADYAAELGIDWSYSVWDINSVEDMRDFAVPFIKVPSAHNTNYTLARRLEEELYTPLIVSLGMQDQGGWESVLDLYSDCDVMCYMHCVSDYPCSIMHEQLHSITKLRDLVSTDVGYSGHGATVAPSIYAAVLGATYIERHFTTDKTLWGTDQGSSLNPAEFRAMVDQIRDVTRALGSYDRPRYLTETEKKVALKLRGC